MSKLKVTIKVNGNPLRRAYVEHLIFGVGAGMYMTDNNGKVRDENGDLGIDSLTPTADIRIFCQNSIVRVLDGTRANIAVHQDKNISDGSSVNLNTNSEQHHHYAILNRCLIAYDVVFRQFRPYSEMSNSDFPLGRKATLRQTREQNKRIEVSYPSQFPLGNLAFVEPRSQSTGYPLIHFREWSSDERLFGGDGSSPTLIPGELAHALHFSRFSTTNRQGIENDYVGWIASEIANGRSGTHAMAVRTSPRVAYIEAFDHFAGRFAEFVRQEVQGGDSTLLQQQEMTAQIRGNFLDSEVSGSPITGTSVATLNSSGNIVPNPTFMGSDDEGSVYGCIFVDFARRVGLRSAVNSYLQSAASGVFSFGGYRSWIASNRPQRLAALEAAQQTWGL